jgi:hypothetical protein
MRNQNGSLPDATDANVNAAVRVPILLLSKERSLILG